MNGRSAISTASPTPPGSATSRGTRCPSLDRGRILALAHLEFIDRNEVVHVLGPPGTGDSHLALALGVEAVKAGRSVSFSTLADIIASPAKAEREGCLRARIRWLARSALLIVDEIG